MAGRKKIFVLEESLQSIMPEAPESRKGVVSVAQVPRLCDFITALFSCLLYTLPA